MAIEAVLFDIGGVLECTPRTDWEQRWATELGLSLEEFERRLAPVGRPGCAGEVTLHGAERQIGTVFGLDEPSLERFMGDFWEEYLGTLNEELTAYFASLRHGRVRYRTGIVSNSFVGAREREQALYGFEDLCDTIIYSHEVRCRKPDPRIYEIACERLAVAPGRAVFLDDVQANVDGALAVGIEAVLFVDTQQAIGELRARLEG
ncbi:MAG: HAD family phosphatase [Solirubrobacteraceae bacterium]